MAAITFNIYNHNIYRPVRNQVEEYERRKNDDHQERLYNEPNVRLFLKAKRLEWDGHVWWAEENLLRNILIKNPTKKRRIRVRLHLCDRRKIRRIFRYQRIKAIGRRNWSMETFNGSMRKSLKTCIVFGKSSWNFSIYTTINNTIKR